jgi:hypothetical protein
MTCRERRLLAIPAITFAFLLSFSAASQEPYRIQVKYPDATPEQFMPAGHSSVVFYMEEQDGAKFVKEDGFPTACEPSQVDCKPASLDTDIQFTSTVLPTSNQYCTNYQYRMKRSDGTVPVERETCVRLK